MKSQTERKGEGWLRVQANYEFLVRVSTVTHLGGVLPIHDVMYFIRKENQWIIWAAWANESCESGSSWFHQKPSHEQISLVHPRPPR